MKRIVLGLFILSSLLFAGNPSKQATWDFIADDYNYGSLPVGWRYTPSFNTDTCKLSLDTRNRGGKIKYIYLKDLDPTQIKYEEKDSWNILYIQCTDNKYCLKRQDGSIYSNDLMIGVIRAEKVGKAYSHLIKLCGGQKELF